MKPNAHIGTIFKTMALACLVLGYASCVEDEEITSLKDMMKSNVVTFGIDVSNKWKPDVIGEGEKATSDGGNYSRTEALPMIAEDGTASSEIYMYMIEEDCPTVVDTVSVASRAEGESTSPKYGIFAYQMESTTEPEAYDPSESSLFMNNIGLKEDFTYFDDADTKYWPGAGYWIQFYAYTPYLSSGVKEFASNERFIPFFEYEVKNDLTNQFDLMAGASKQMYGGSDVENTVKIELEHLLSQIEVKAGTIDVGKIEMVRFSHIVKKGTYTLGESENWAVTKNDTTHYEQTDLNITTADKDETIGEPFYFIPHELANEAEIIIWLKVDNAGSLNEEGKGEEKTFVLKKNLKEFTTNWSPNKKYTFVLSTPEEVEVEVTDKLSEDLKTKSDLVIKNTGLSSCYIRAAIVGTWVTTGSDDDSYEDDIAVAMWNSATEGTFVWGKDNGNAEPTSTATTGWRKHTDGYYYHLNPVSRGATTATLFESFSVENVNAPVAGAVLDLTILVQAVLPDDVSDAWPSEITNQFTQVAFVRE